ncbi:MAG TPA: glycoside hydrolase family 6 protein [Microlunatus sp.]
MRSRSLRLHRKPMLLTASVGALVLLVIAVILIKNLPGSADDDRESRTAQVRCARLAAQMPQPWHFNEPRAGAAPDSPFRQAPMYVPEDAPARQAIRTAADAGDAARAARLSRLAEQPRALWFADSSVAGTRLRDQVADAVAAARRAGRVITLVAYNIPLRDCGGYSAGGASSGQAYVRWIESFIGGLIQGGASDGPGVAVILEPDALGLLNDLPADRRTERLDLLRAATSWLSDTDKVAVYLDAGTVDWLSAQQAADRLSHAGVAKARGFALNVSNYYRVDTVVDYGRRISAAVGWKSFVVDTGRSGNGLLTDDRDEAWCNPPGRALGPTPQADPAANVDAYLWVKPPGESDGDCGRDEPVAGQFWPDRADQLAKAAGW